MAPEQPHDQREDDGKSLVFDTAPLEERLEILDPPVVHLDLEVDKPVAQIVVRLCDVSPDGASMRVSYMPSNLTRCDGHETPRPLEPGKRYRVRVQLKDTGGVEGVKLEQQVLITTKGPQVLTTFPFEEDPLK